MKIGGGRRPPYHVCPPPLRVPAGTHVIRRCDPLIVDNVSTVNLDAPMPSCVPAGTRRPWGMGFRGPSAAIGPRLYTRSPPGSNAS